MRVLYSRYALPNPGFDPEDAQNAASQIAGKDMTEFFQKYVFGREPIPYERVLSYAGISLETMPRTAAWIGATLSTDSAGRAMVAHFTPGSPAERAGLYRRDSIV